MGSQQLTIQQAGGLIDLFRVRVAGFSDLPADKQAFLAEWVGRGEGAGARRVADRLGWGYWRVIRYSHDPECCRLLPQCYVQMWEGAT